MKKLLGSLSALILGGTSLGSMPIMVQNQSNQKNMVDSVEYYWNENHTEEIKTLHSKNNADGWSVQRTLYTFEVGIKKPTFNTLSFINSKGFIAAWGNRTKTWEASDLAISFEHENYFQFNDENIDNTKFDQFATSTIVNHHAEELNGFYTVDFTTKIGNVWYNENDVYYIQVLLYQYINEYPANIEMAMNYASLGDKLKLS